MREHGSRFSFSHFISRNKLLSFAAYFCHIFSAVVPDLKTKSLFLNNIHHKK